MLRFFPQMQYATKSLGGLRSSHWRDVAVENWELSPAETRVNPAPICIDGQLDKTRSMDHQWRVENIPNLFASERSHKATTAHLLKNVDLVGTSLFCGRMHHRLSDQRPALFNRELVERVPSGVLAAGYSGNVWFGHFIGDTIPLCHMALDVAATRKAEVFSPPLITDALGQRQRYLELQELTPRFLSRAHFDELVIIDPLGVNAYHREKVLELRRRIREHVPRAFGNHKVYLSRGNLGVARSPINEAEVEEFFAAQGFHILKPEQMSLDALLAAMLDAQVVAGVEGSQLLHALPAAGEGATLLVLQPPQHFVTSHKVWAEAIGMRWAFLVGEPHAKRYVIDLNELRQTLDLL